MFDRIGDVARAEQQQCVRLDLLVRVVVRIPSRTLAARAFGKVVSLTNFATRDDARDEMGRPLLTCSTSAFFPHFFLRCTFGMLFWILRCAFLVQSWPPRQRSDREKLIQIRDDSVIETSVSPHPPDGELSSFAPQLAPDPQAGHAVARMTYKHPLGGCGVPRDLFAFRLA